MATESVLDNYRQKGSGFGGGSSKGKKRHVEWRNGRGERRWLLARGTQGARRSGMDAARLTRPRRYGRWPRRWASSRKTTGVSARGPRSISGLVGIWIRRGTKASTTGRTRST